MHQLTAATQVMTGSYDFQLVALSVLIAIVSAYAALDLAGRVTAATGRARSFWLAGGASSMGLGIWSMHYVGMLAWSLPVPVYYDWPTVVVSLVAAIAASGVALYVVSRDVITPATACAGGIFMGSGIAAMHYIGMEAMRLSGICHYSIAIVLVSVVLAVGISFTALWLTFSLRNEAVATPWRKFACALLMGLAIPVMHYTGMAAVTYSRTDTLPDLTHAMEVSRSALPAS